MTIMIMHVKALSIFKKYTKNRNVITKSNKTNEIWIINQAIY